MSKLVKAVIILILVLGIGYIAQQRGMIDVELNGSVTVGRDGSSGGRLLWVNTNFSQAAPEPRRHIGDRVSLDVYVFNSFTLDNGATAYEAYLGSPTQLSEHPYDTSKRILMTYTEDTIMAEECYHVTGSIAGEATVTTAGGDVIHPAYVDVSNASHSDVCYGSR